MARFFRRRKSEENTKTLSNFGYHCEEHFEKHGIEMGFASAKEYEKAAAAVVADSRGLHKLEKEDGDGVF